jgi:hypothetical protein
MKILAHGKEIRGLPAKLFEQTDQVFEKITAL